MLHNLKYFFKQGFRNFAKNGVTSIASVVIITACLVLFGVYQVVGINLNYLGTQLKSQFQIDVYITRSVSEAKTLDIGETLKTLDNVKSVEYVSKVEAFEKLKEMQKDNPDLIAGYDAVNNNPLMASYRLTLEELADMGSLKSEIVEISGVEKVVTKDDAMNNMLRTINTIKTASLWIMLAFALVSVLIISNAIKMTVFARRKEINIMKFIGATDSFIRSPFIVEGVIVGVVGAVIALAIVMFLYGCLVAATSNFLAGIFQLKSVVSLLPIMAGSLVGFGGLLGAVGSWISTKKHLRV